MTRLSLIATCLTVVFLTALLSGAPPTGDEKDTAVNAERFHEPLLDIAKGYKKFAAVDPDARWAPQRCAAFQPRSQPGPRFSNSKDAETHGRKLYFLFAWDKTTYVGLEDKPVAVGQAIVKESWAPVEDKTVRKEDLPAASVIDKDGKVYRAGKQGALFIMLKLDPKTPETDNGWVYGTVTADAKTVTSSGRVESCMSCHKEAKHDRLFGLARTPGK